MSFSMNNCTVVRDRNRKENNGCYSSISKFDNYLTPKIKDGLFQWLTRKIAKFGCSEITKETVYEDIKELLLKCCHVERIELLMRRDVESAEPEIVSHIKYAIKSKKVRGIYNARHRVASKEELDNMTTINAKDLKRLFGKGV